jgi:hypothetical protein
MTDIRNHDESPPFVHWTYTRDEWDRFIRWKKKKKGLFYYLAHRLFYQKQQTSGYYHHRGKVSIDVNMSHFAMRKAVAPHRYP